MRNWRQYKLEVRDWPWKWPYSVQQKTKWKTKPPQVKKSKRQLSHNPFGPHERKISHSSRLFNLANSCSPREKSLGAQVRIKLHFLRLCFKMKLTSCQSRLQRTVLSFLLELLCWSRLDSGRSMLSGLNTEIFKDVFLAHRKSRISKQKLFFSLRSVSLLDWEIHLFSISRGDGYFLASDSKISAKSSFSLKVFLWAAPGNVDEMHFYLNKHYVSFSVFFSGSGNGKLIPAWLAG